MDFKWLFRSSKSKLETIEPEIQEDINEEFDTPEKPDKPNRYIVGQNSIRTKEMIKEQFDAAIIMLNKIQAARDEKLKAKKSLYEKKSKMNNCPKIKQKDIEKLNEKVITDHFRVK